MTRIRRARTLILSIEGFDLFGFNFITRHTTAIDELGFAILRYSEPWIYSSDVFHFLGWSYDQYRISNEISKLLSLGFLVAEGSQLSEIDIEYDDKWVWGTIAGNYHFGIKDPYYMTPEETSAWIEDRVSSIPLVPLYMTNEGLKEVVSLPPPRFDREVFSIMRARRSYRGFEPSASKSISIEQLRDCLFSGFGIVGFIETPITDQGRLPLTMTPSGGARNPYEAYVYVRNVAGLRKGIYHYSAVDNTLGLIADSNLPTIGDILAIQPWFDNAAALIILVANFERTMWKYPHPTGFRVVLLEAGHIAQNIALAATANDLASAPTCAISDSVAQSLLGLNPVTQSVIYTVAIGVRSKIPTQADAPMTIPNPNFE